MAQLMTTDALDEYIAACRELMGTQVGIGQSGTILYNEEATRDTIRHYAWGVSDMNPLWLDEEYARKGRHGGIIAPPTFLYSVVLPSMGRWRVKFPNSVRWTQLYGGTTWDFYQNVRIGDRFHATGTIVGASIKESKTAGRMGIVLPEVKYWNQRGVLVAKAVASNVVFPTRDISSSYEEALKPQATGMLVPEVIEENLSRRGEEPRYWEHVQEGEQLPDIPKGRLRNVDIIRWNAGAYGPLPLVSRINQETGTRGGEGHYDEDIAKSEGLPGLYDNGPLRGGWLSELVTNWAGDWGDLVRLSYELRRMNIVGDVNTVKGSVVRKLQREEDKLVEIAVSVQNHRGENSAIGTATVRLPSLGVENS